MNLTDALKSLMKDLEGEDVVMVEFNEEASVIMVTYEDGDTLSLKFSI